MASNKPTIVPVTSLPENINGDEPITIAKSDEFGLDKFKSNRAVAIAGVEKLLTALPHHPMAAAKDFVRLHPDETGWSPEFCLVNVPIQGQPRGTLHLIDEGLATQYLPGGQIKRFRFALATQPNDKFFLCEVPSQNLDNTWNATNLQACIKAKTLWTKANSRREEGIDGYEISFAKDTDAFPEPTWPTQQLGRLIVVTFCGRMIDAPNHPGLLRLIGAKQSMS
jgi:hypothetical protein